MFLITFNDFMELKVQATSKWRLESNSDFVRVGRKPELCEEQQR
jgi:hypothetical protein